MLDIRFIIENVELMRRNAKQRYVNVNIDLVVDLYQQLKMTRQAIEEIQRQLNLIAGQFMAADEKTRLELKAKRDELKTQLETQKKKINTLEKAYVAEAIKVPNLAAPEVPEGRDETCNVPIKHVGEVKKFDFKPLDNIELGRQLDIVDFETATKVTGPKFYFLKNEAVILELGLIRFALDIAIKHGFTPMATPDIARDEIITASGFTPRGPESQIYSLDGGLSLIGTSEITIGGCLANMVLAGKDLPLKITGVSHCFRTEAGSSGRESKGLYRVHQFSKVELYQFVHPTKGNDALEEMLVIEEEFYQALALPYRVMLICKGDLGAPAYKKYDIEAWMPFIGDGGGYGEVTSASNCTDFQARRLNVRFKDESTGKKEFVYTLNGTVVAVTRTMLALLENNQKADGSISLPEVLHPYVGFKEIRPKNKKF